MSSERQLTTTDVSGLLYVEGIKASRDKVNRMADAIFGRRDHRRHRRYSPADVDLLAQAFRLEEEGFDRQHIALMVRDPVSAPERIRAETEEEIRRLSSALRRVQERISA